MRPGPSWGEGDIGDTFWHHKTHCGGPKAQLWGLDVGEWVLRGLAGHGGWKRIGWAQGTWHLTRVSTILGL